eukprot:scaffold49463_cov47-Attheya_sp.AAC.1
MVFAAPSGLFWAFVSCLAFCSNFAHVVSAFGGTLSTGRSSRVAGTIRVSQSWMVSQEEAVGSNHEEIALNPLVASVKISKTVEIFSLVKEMEASGIEVTSLCVGEPDFDPPQAVLDAAVAAVTSGETRYTAVTGTAALRGAICDDLQRRKGVTYAPEHIVVGNGAKQCVYQGVLATCGPGDAVIIPAPYWPSYPEMVALAGATPLILQTQQKDGYLVDPASLRTMLETHTNAKLLIFCNPSNPTGGVHSRERLEEIAAVLRDFPRVAILADEIYERLVYGENAECPCFAGMPGMWERTMTVNGFSKAYAMTGLRLGYMAAPPRFAKAVTTIQSQLTSCASSIGQAAGVAALTKVTDAELDQNVAIMQGKRDYVISELKKMPNVELAVPPNGAFYVLPDVSAYYNGDDTALCLDLLKQQRLAIVPGSSFGAPGTIRLSYATSMEELQTAMSKLATFLSEQ